MVLLYHHFSHGASISSFLNKRIESYATIRFLNIPVHVMIAEKQKTSSPIRRTPVLPTTGDSTTTHDYYAHDETESAGGRRRRQTREKKIHRLFGRATVKTLTKEHQKLLESALASSESDGSAVHVKKSRKAGERSPRPTARPPRGHHDRRGGGGGRSSVYSSYDFFPHIRNYGLPSPTYFFPCIPRRRISDVCPTYLSSKSPLSFSLL